MKRTIISISFIIVICLFIIINGNFENKTQLISESKTNEVKNYTESNNKTTSNSDSKEFLNLLSTKLPYKGLEEKYINNTILGEADEVEKCLDFYKLRMDSRSVKYTWYNSNGKVRAIASVRYWNYKTDKAVPGYISSISFYFQEN